MCSILINKKKGSVFFLSIIFIKYLHSKIMDKDYYFCPFQVAFPSLKISWPPVAKNVKVKIVALVVSSNPRLMSKYFLSQSPTSWYPHRPREEY